MHQKKEQPAIGHVEIYKENPSRRRECLYYLALGEYRLGNYQQARHFNQSLLSMEPHNQQAQSLAKLIAERVQAGNLSLSFFSYL